MASEQQETLFLFKIKNKTPLFIDDNIRLFDWIISLQLTQIKYSREKQDDLVNKLQKPIEFDKKLNRIKLNISFAFCS